MRIIFMEFSYILVVTVYISIVKDRKSCIRKVFFYRVISKTFQLK